MLELDGYGDVSYFTGGGQELDDTPLKYKGHRALKCGEVKVKVGRYL